jgi:Rhodopirellula transposase DDE domain
VRASLDKNQYPSGIKVTDEELAAIALKPDKFHGEWNYSIRPRGVFINGTFVLAQILNTAGPRHLARFKYDGSLIELYRYALDAAGMDYIHATDHNSGTIRNSRGGRTSN